MSFAVKDQLGCRLQVDGADLEATLELDDMTLRHEDLMKPDRPVFRRPRSWKSMVRSQCLQLACVLRSNGGLEIQDRGDV